MKNSYIYRFRWKSGCYSFLNKRRTQVPGGRIVEHFAKAKSYEKPFTFEKAAPLGQLQRFVVPYFLLIIWEKSNFKITS